MSPDRTDFEEKGTRTVDSRCSSSLLLMTSYIADLSTFRQDVIFRHASCSLKPDENVRMKETGSR